MKKGIACKVIACLLALFVAVSFMPQPASAATKTVKSTTYDQVVKSGNTAYCAGANALYKVKLTKNGKVKKVTCTYKGGPAWDKKARLIRNMKKKGKYLYYVDFGGSDGSVTYLKRMNTATKKSKKIVFTDNMFYGYAIKKGKLYAKYHDDDKVVKKSMKLNGKSKKKTSKKIVMKTKKSNAKGYSMKYKAKKGYIKAYLKTPKGTYYLGKTKYY